MYFNVDRIAILAGLDRSGSSGLMREGAGKPAMAGGTPVAASKPAAPPAPAAPKAAAPPAKPAPTAQKAVGGKPAMAEDDMELEEMYDEGAYEEDVYEEDMEDGAMEEMYMDDMGPGGMGGMDDMYMDEMGHDKAHSKETVYEIDEMQLMEALVDMREKRLEEGKFRSKVRREISDVLNEMESGSRWIYGNKKPANSGKGSVSRGFLGPGFR